MRKLINPRGRVIQVEDWQVPDLLRRGFLNVPREEEDVYYNQIYDKGPGYQAPYNPNNVIQKREVPALGDVLEAEVI